MLVLICVHSICIIFFLWNKYSTSLQHQKNWCQPPLLIARLRSRANGGAPVPAPMVALLFRRVLTSVRPTLVPPTPHPVHQSHPSHPSHPASNHPAHKSQFLLIHPMRYDPIQPIWYDPADNTIRYSQQYDTIHPMIQYGTVSPIIRKSHSRPILSCLTDSSSRFYDTFPSDAPSSDFSPSPAASAARYLLSSSAAVYSADFFASDLDSAIPKANVLAFLIASPSGKYFEVTRECLMEPRRHRFCWFFIIDCSLWVIVPLTCWW